METFIHRLDQSNKQMELIIIRKIFAAYFITTICFLSLSLFRLHVSIYIICIIHIRPWTVDRVRDPELVDQVTRDHESDRNKSLTRLRVKS